MTFTSFSTSQGRERREEEGRAKLWTNDSRADGERGKKATYSPVFYVSNTHHRKMLQPPKPNEEGREGRR